MLAHKFFYTCFTRKGVNREMNFYFTPNRNGRCVSRNQVFVHLGAFENQCAVSKFNFSIFKKLPDRISLIKRMKIKFMWKQNTIHCIFHDITRQKCLKCFLDATYKRFSNCSQNPQQMLNIVSKSTWKYVNLYSLIKQELSAQMCTFIFTFIF